MGYLCLSAVLLILGGIYLFTGVDSQTRPSPPDMDRTREIVTRSAFWRLGLMLSLAVGVETGVYAMIPLFLVNERAFDLADANRLLGLSRIPGIVMVLLAGWLTDRLNPAVAVSAALGLTGGAVVCLGIGPDIMLVPAVFVQAAASACLFPPILAMASNISTPENRALMLSLSLAVAPVAGGGLIPAAIALAGDISTFGAGLAGAGLLTIAGILLVRHK
jgi:NNP family nitrate/nitrite transporter-like MFS transporter